MSKPTPLQYGRYYHIYNRGNNRENIFIDGRNYSHFLKLYTRYVEPVADTYAYCLLRNHFHFLVRIKTVEEQETQSLFSAPLDSLIWSILVEMPLHRWVLPNPILADSSSGPMRNQVFRKKPGFFPRLFEKDTNRLRQGAKYRLSVQVRK